MAKFKYRAGDTFGKWTLISYAGEGQWTATCECGRESKVYTCHLASGASTSCGKCGAYQTHGMTGTPEYQSWSHMRYRCENPTNDRYKDYGGRGIKVCERWSKFENFFADMGPRPEEGSIDRIDVNGDYTPENCRWATWHQQYQNRRSSPIVDGERVSMKELARRVGTPYGRIQARVFRGWDLEDALEVPPVKGQRGFRKT